MSMLPPFVVRKLTKALLESVFHALQQGARVSMLYLYVNLCMDGFKTVWCWQHRSPDLVSSSAASAASPPPKPEALKVKESAAGHGSPTSERSRDILDRHTPKLLASVVLVISRGGGRGGAVA